MKSPKHAEQVMRRLETDVFPEIGALPVDKFTAARLGEPDGG